MSNKKQASLDHAKTDRPPANPPTKYLTVAQAADFLGLKPGTVYQWVFRAPDQTDPLPFVKFSSRCLRFSADELAAWASRRRNATPTLKNAD